MREVERKHPLEQLPYEVASLRKRNLRAYRQSRQCALFCYGIGQLIGTRVRYADIEESDYDCIAHYEKDSTDCFVPIQMKEFVPERVNKATSLQGLVNDLRKYKDSSDLVVAVYLNRRIKQLKVDITSLDLGGLWFFGATSKDQSKWTIFGDVLKPDADSYEFMYPGA